MLKKILVQSEDFSLEQHYQWLSNQQAGAVCLFSGLVRQLTTIDEEQYLELEHYPGMTESQLALIVEQANQRWPLLATVVVHRYGRLHAGDQIVLVGTASSHRAEAFAACEYIMDYLKTDAPFWKKEVHGKTSSWVQSREDDLLRHERWLPGGKTS